jgi:hypothetical protein
MISNAHPTEKRWKKALRKHKNNEAQAKKLQQKNSFLQSWLLNSCAT